jgi:hypothetical protein
VDPNEASANVGQQVTIEGADFDPVETKVTLEAMETNGVPAVITVTPDSVAGDGSSLTFTVPEKARAGVGTIMSGGSGLPLQIVPRVTGISGGRGRVTTISGTGFIESFVTVRFGDPANDVVDGGPFSNDGVDVFNINRSLNVTVPLDGDLPYEVITEGGSSGRTTDVSAIAAVATTGTPDNGGEASANVGQQVTIDGADFDLVETKVTLEAMETGGVPFIITVTPDSVAGDGSSLIFTIPSQARTGIGTILNGGVGVLLQIVPVLSTVSSTTPGQVSALSGTGFIEGFISVDFGGVIVVDGGPFSNDGVDVFNLNNSLNVTVPTGGSAPVQVTTEGGASESITP